MTRRGWWLLALVIAGLALAASGNSLTNGFAYDDIYVIEIPKARMSTFAGWWREFAATYWPAYGNGPGDGYRPLAILAFKAQWILGGGSPMAFHATNIALHVAGAVAVFWLACGVLPVGAAWIAAALYAVHPVHTEAIANVVGQSELAVALLLTLAMALFVYGRRGGPVTPWRWTAIGVLYAAAMLFKEHGIVLLALIPLAELTVVPDRAPWTTKLARLRTPLLALLAVAVAYMWARGLAIQGGTGFQPFIVFQSLGMSTMDRVLTMIGAAPEWLRLLLWPARLTTEYSPPEIALATGPEAWQLPGMLVLVGVLGLGIASWRRSSVTAFGIGWMVVALLPSSNFLLPAGFIIAERTLMLPSVGAMLAIGSAVPWLYERIEGRRVPQLMAGAAVATLLALGLARSITRNPVWQSTEVLMRQSVEDAPESYRAHFMLGVVLFDQGRLTEGERHMREALRLFPYDPFMIWTLAERYRTAGFCHPALRLYEAFYELKSTPTGLLGYAECLLAQGRPNDARRAAMTWIAEGGGLTVPRKILKDAAAMRDSMDARHGGNGDPSH